MECLERHFASWIDAVTSCLRSRIKAQDIDLLTHSITILATCGWEWQESTHFGHPALEAIASKFEIALAKVSGFERVKLMETRRAPACGWRAPGLKIIYMHFLIWHRENVCVFILTMKAQLELAMTLLELIQRKEQ